MAGLIQSADGLKRTKRLTFLQVRGNFLLSDCLQPGHCVFFFFFTVLGFKLEHWLSLGLEPASSGLEFTPSVLLGLQLAVHRS